MKRWSSRLRGQLQRSCHATGLIAGLGTAAGAAVVAVLPAWLAMLLTPLLGVLVWRLVVAPGLRSDLALRESERKFRNVVEQSLVGLYVVQNGKVAYVNRKTSELLGYDDPEQMIGLSMTDLTHPDDVPLLAENQRLRLRGDVASIRYTYRALRRDGQVVWAEVQGSVCEYQGRPAIMGVALDVSRQVGFEHQSRLANKVFESASEGIIITDAAFRIEAVNPAFSRITGYGAGEAIGKLSRMLTGHGAEANAETLAQLARDGNWQGEVRDRRKNGNWYPAWMSISIVRDDEQRITNYVGVFTDNTRRKEDETRLRFLASHDSLTGTLNRSGMMARFALEIGHARGGNQQLALLFIDLDRFKTVNDTLGHSAGDQLLVAATQRIRQQLSGNEIIARLGGDEFTILTQDTPGSSNAAKLADRVLRSLGQPFAIDGQEMFVTASIGIACYPADGMDAPTLLKNADVAMYRAKERGRNTFQFFTADMNTQAFEQMLLENSLRRALERGEFELHYQPQFVTGGTRLAGMEALIRWRHPELGMVFPGTFIPLAEQNGLIIPIGAWVLREACRQAKAWLDQGRHCGRVAVNLSARQFAADDLLDTIRQALVSSALPPSMLELELTESAIMQNPGESVPLLHRLRDMGVALSIDDFGTGYSSLASLKQYPLDSLKIDRGFIKGVPHDADDVAITEAIIAVARKMGLKVVAEGVETTEQADFLKRAGCDVSQGYLLGRPMAAHEAMALMAATTRHATDVVYR